MENQCGVVNSMVFNGDLGRKWGQSCLASNHSFPYNTTIMNATPQEIIRIQDLIFHEDKEVIEQGFALLESLTSDPNVVLQVFGVSKSPSSLDECWSDRWPNSTALYLHLSLFALLVELEVAWACSISELNLNINPRNLVGKKTFKPTVFPSSFARLTSITDLALQNHDLPAIPNEISQWTQLRRLDLEDNYIRELPDWLGGLTQLTELSLLANEIHTLPSTLVTLEQLTQLELSWNPVWVLEDGARALSLSDEQWAHTTVRQQVCQMTSLRFLRISAEGYGDFPEDWSKMIHLEELHVSAMHLSSSPIWLQTIPNLKRLRFWVHQGSEECYEQIRSLLPDCEFLNF